MKAKASSITKFEDGVLNEDAVYASASCIAVSDGAGGGGVFAERWSQYLVYNLPSTPITTFESLDGWIESIWERFYNECEQWAKKQQDGMFLNKFYDEGSFATLAAMWLTDEGMCWMAYGDSVVFHYNRRTKILEHTFTKLADFNKPPYLINCKDPLQPEGFRCGTFSGDRDSVFIVTSDTLAHYILMMYLVAHKDSMGEELNNAIEAQSKNSQLVKTAMALPRVRFKRDVIDKLVHCAGHKSNLTRYLQALRRKGLIGHDDYSFAVMH